MALEIEIVVDRGMGGDEPLRLALGFEPLHFPLSSPDRQMRVLDAVVVAYAPPSQTRRSVPLLPLLAGGESYITKKRDKSAALRFMRKALKRHGRPEAVVTDGLKSYPAAMRALGNDSRRETGRHKNNRAENSHLPFRRRERAMQRFRRMKSLQKFASVHASLHNHFSHERHLVDRQTYKLRRSAALAEWQNLMG